jgi:hypothetical protein
VYQALTAARDELGGPETVQLDKLRKWAKETFESVPEKYVQWAADMADQDCADEMASKADEMVDRAKDRGL